MVLPRVHASSLIDEMLLQLAQGIAPPPRTTPTDRLSLLAWTERYRTIQGVPLRPSKIPWLREMYSWDADEIRIMKASQVFMSELMINTALWVCDTAQGGRGNALYIFPTQSEADDFSQARIDPAIHESSYLGERTGSVYEDHAGRRRSRTAASRVRLRRIGQGFLYLRGGDKRRQLLTVDGDAILCDEVDEYRRGIIDVARQRLNSALDPLVRMASTPKYPSSGIAPLFDETTKRRFFIPCDACGEKQPLVFPDNLTEDGELVCRSCRGPMSCTQEGEWVAEKPDAEVEGFHVNRLYSPRANLLKIADDGYDIESHVTTDPESIQEFKNQTLGLPHAPAGGALTDEILNACKQDYSIPAAVTMQPVCIGVDVGGVLHFWVEAPAPDQVENPGGTRMLDYGVLPNTDGPDGEVWPELGNLMRRYRARLVVVDALPEDERSARFVEQWRGRAYRCFYHDEAQWRYAGPAAWNVDEGIVHANRTRMMDAAFNRFHHSAEELPRDANFLSNLYPHLKAPVRVLVTDARNRQVARYQEGLAADHLAHAKVYAEIARQFEPMAPTPPDSRTRRPVRVKV